MKKQKLMMFFRYYYYHVQNRFITFRSQRKSKKSNQNNKIWMSLIETENLTKSAYFDWFDYIIIMMMMIIIVFYIYVLNQKTTTTNSPSTKLLLFMFNDHHHHDHHDDETWTIENPFVIIIWHSKDSFIHSLLCYSKTTKPNQTNYHHYHLPSKNKNWCV